MFMKMVSVKVASRMLGVTPPTVYAMINRGIPGPGRSRKVNGVMRVSVDAIDRMRLFVRTPGRPKCKQ